MHTALRVALALSISCSPRSDGAPRSAPPAPPAPPAPNSAPMNDPPTNDPRTTGNPKIDVALATLPPCGADPLLTVMPTNPDDLSVINPLGKWNPPGNHVFPVNHHYVIMRTPNFMDPNAGLQANLLAPATMRIVAIVGGKTVVNGTLTRTDYALTAWVCDRLRVSFAHISHPNDAFFAAFGPLDQDCATGDFGGTHTESCSAYPNKDIAAGTLIGTTQAYDFGAEDFRITPHPFLRETKVDDFIVSPFEYLSHEARAAYAPYVGGGWGDGPGGRPAHFAPRTIEPIFGDVSYDLPKTARGKWYQPNKPDMPDGVHAALAPDWLHPDTTAAFSLGSFVGAGNVGTYLFDLGTGAHNRAFDQVKADGTVYCYDGFYDRHLDPALGSPTSRVLLKLVDDTHLTLEVQQSADCSQPIALTNAAVTYER